MTETRDIRSVVEAAEQAAAAGDYATAETLLTEVARLQEASLGPLHPDLANTLNNLGVVCEITEKPADAERYFRRAYAIATAALAPDHPFVATSRKNLEDFCNTRGIAVEARPVQPPGSGAGDVPSSPPAAPTGHDEPPLPAIVAVDDDVPEMVPAVLRTARPTFEEPRPVASRRWSGPVVIGGVIVGVLLVTLLATAPWRGEPVPADAPKAIPAEPREPTAVAPKAIETPPPTPVSPPVVKPTPVPPAPVKSRATTAAPATPPVVAATRLCKELSTGSDWHCAPPSSPVDPGPVYFYSRVKSPTDTTIQHRWYHGGRLLRTAELRIRANAIDGYRTFSRTTVNSRGSADWRIELRTKDGVLLHEERFVVR